MKICPTYLCDDCERPQTIKTTPYTLGTFTYHLCAGCLRKMRNLSEAEQARLIRIQAQLTSLFRK